MIGCTKGRGKICPHVPVLCANCGGSHIANPLWCILKQKASIKANKEKKLKKRNEKEKEKAVSKDGDDVIEREKSLEPETKMDLEAEKWARSPSEEGLDLDASKSLDHTQSF